MIDPVEENDELDRLLQEARWPAPLRGAQERLRSRLIELPHKQRPIRTMLVWPLAAFAAAAVLAVALIPQLLVRQRPSKVSPARFAGYPAEHHGLQSNQPREIIGRPLDLSDRLALIECQLSARRSRPVAEPPHPLQTSRPVASLDEIRRAMADPRLDDEVPPLLQTATVGTLDELTNERTNLRWHAALAAELLKRGPTGLAAVLNMLADPARRETARSAFLAAGASLSAGLTAQLDNPLVESRLAAARELGRVSSDDTVARLIAMVQHGDHAREAIAALINCTQPRAQEFISAYQARPGVGVLHQREIQLLRKETTIFD